MSGLTKSLLATALTLPLVAFVLGILVAPDEPEPDRSRPVIIGQVDDDGDDAREDDVDDRATSRGDRGRPADRDGTSDDERDDRRERSPVTVVTPAPRDLGADDDDHGVSDDDSDGDDETDDGGESDD
jgi:hypothetical protein